MRIGTNPEKIKLTKLIHKPHRIIIPFWIPNATDDYFKYQPEVLRLCLQSLIDSVNFSRTNITLINNNSCPEATEIAEEFVKKGFIDKYIKQVENRGKLEVLLAEARGASEEYITISDSDFLFYKGWEETVIQIFNKFKRAGVVTSYPVPNHAFAYNARWVFSSRWKSGSIVDKKEMDLVNHGLGNKELGIYSSLGVRKKLPWYEKQYFLEKDGVKVCIGAIHALATMKRDIFKQLPFKKIEYVFKQAAEEEYMDYFSNLLGYYRLSTPICWAYHMGNTIPDIEIINKRIDNQIHSLSFPPYKKRNLWWNKKITFVQILIVRALRKFKLI